MGMNPDGTGMHGTYSMPAKDLDDARVEVKKLSKPRKLPIILISSKAWEKYEQGELVDQSIKPLADEPIEDDDGNMINKLAK